MRQIINDWIEFCENDKPFEESYFYTIFMENISKEEIEIVYRSFPNSDQLTDRMNKFLFEEDVQIPNNEKQKILGELIQFDFLERETILKSLPAFSKFNMNHKFVYYEDRDVVNDLILDDVWIQDFHDYIFGQMSITDKKAYELLDALYGISNDFDYQLFLFLPLLKTEYSMKHLYKFRKAGGIYAITETEVVYSF